MKTITVAALTEQLEPLTAFVEGVLEDEGCPYAVIMQMNVALDEIFTNISLYAYGAEGGEVTVSCGVENGSATLVFTDSGVPYNPLAKADPDVTLSAEERQIGGLGIFMVKKMSDSMDYEYVDGKNVLTVCKKVKK